MSGQWIYEDDDNTDAAHYVRDAETGEVVLIVPFDPDDDESFEAAKRRAIRASALPDLEAACVAAIDSGIASHNHWDDTQGRGDGCPLCIRQREAAAKLRAAIAKAKGAGQ